jgi:glycosyltransferase involved in cell wall biosynthesis
MVKINILLATYNGESFLSEQIDSILSQSNQDWSIIAHDDGSTDKTVEILKKYQTIAPGKITLIEDGFKSGGAKNNFHHLLHFSDAPYVMFCDQDDIWFEDKIEITLQRMLSEEEKTPQKPILVHADLNVVDKDLNTIALSMFDYQRLPREIGSLDEILAQNNVTGCTMMINRKAIDVSLPIAHTAIMHDWWIACKVVQHAGIVSFIPRSVIAYRQHDGNSVGSKKINLRHYFLKLSNSKLIATSLLAIWKQAYTINRDVSLFRFGAIKAKFILSRIIG